MPHLATGRSVRRALLRPEAAQGGLWDICCLFSKTVQDCIEVLTFGQGREHFLLRSGRQRYRLLAVGRTWRGGQALAFWWMRKGCQNAGSLTSKPGSPGWMRKSYFTNRYVWPTFVAWQRRLRTRRSDVTCF